MSILSSLQDPILPIFMVMLVGYFMRRVNFFDVPSAQGINRFVFYLAMPALLFNLVRSVSFHEIDWTTVNAYLISEFLVYGGVAFIAYKLFKRPLGESILIGMAAGFVNHVMFVLPIARSLYGSEAITPVVAIVFVDVVVFCLTIFLIDFIKALESKKVGAFSPKNVMLMLSKNPMVIATVLGLLAGAYSTYIPSGVFTYAQFLGAAAPPAALFALGVILGGQPLSPVGGPAWLVIGAKLIVQPALFWALAGVGGLLVMKPDWETLAFLVAAGPCGAMPFVIALQYKIKPEVIAKAVLISTVLSLLSLSVLTAV
jgi:malonate transporter and related proteins